MIPSFKTYFYQVFLENNDVDKQYFEAIKNQDEQTLRKLVDQKAAEAGYNIGPVYHGSPEVDISKRFDLKFKNSNAKFGKGFYFSTLSDDVTNHGNPNVYMLHQKNKFIADGNVDILSQISKNDWDILGPLALDDYFGDIYVVKNSKNIKMANTKTYDDSGQIIPLSMRFDISNNDARY